MLAVLVAAAGSPSSPSLDLGQFLQYGVLGLLVVALVTGLLVPGYLYKAERDENTRLKKVIEDRLVSTATEYADAMQDASRTLDKAIDVIASRDSGEPFDRRSRR